MIVQLGDSDSYIALKASEKLVEIGEPAIPELIEVLKRSDVDSRRELALETLQKIGEPSVHKLIPLLEDSSINSQVAETLLFA